MPTYGVRNFNKDRLVQAKNARGLSSTGLAEIVRVSPSSISLYENGKQNPKQEIVHALADALNVPYGSFFKEITIDKPKNLFYRSMAASTKASRVVSEAKYEWVLEVIEYLLIYIDFPELSLPDLGVPKDFRDLDSNIIESLAKQLRECWTLGMGPITNMVRAVESNGIVVWRTKFEAETQDAFSELRYPHPFIILASDKENYFRSRFDAAHELGHLVLHQNVDQTTLNTKSDFRLIEDQAHLFAGAFLAPATAYIRDLPAISIDAFRALKPRWNISIAMQIMRVKHLGLVTHNEEKRLWINLSRRKWRIVEPLDESTEPEMPQLIKNSIKLLVNEGVKLKEQIIDDLKLSHVDIENIIEEYGYMRKADESGQPVLKSQRGKVIPFPQK